MNYNGAEDLEFGGGTTKIDPSVARGKYINVYITPRPDQIGAGNTLLQHYRPDAASCPQTCTAKASGRTRAESTPSLQMVRRVPFFIKVQSGGVGRDMLSSEHESMKALHAVTLEFVPRPIAWGVYESVPDTYFFLSEFREMRKDVLPGPETFAARLAKLHWESVSPNGKFGFHVGTFAGNLPQYTDWEDSWEIFFAKSMRQALDLEIKAKGYDPEFHVLIPTLFDTVIPRLLRPLESDGRRVKPSLVHGDLWFANSGIDADSDEPLIFDACCFYAHNECTLQDIRP
jgi:protein-ribulosamine 3-kinase